MNSIGLFVAGLALGSGGGVYVSRCGGIPPRQAENEPIIIKESTDAPGVETKTDVKMLREIQIDIKNIFIDVNNLCNVLLIDNADTRRRLQLSGRLNGLFKNGISFLGQTNVEKIKEFLKEMQEDFSRFRDLFLDAIKKNKKKANLVLSDAIYEKDTKILTAKTAATDAQVLQALTFLIQKVDECIIKVTASAKLSQPKRGESRAVRRRLRNAQEQRQYPEDAFCWS